MNTPGPVLGLTPHSRGGRRRTPAAVAPAGVRPPSRRRALRYLAAASAVLVASCTPGSDLHSLPDTRPGSYKLGVGDEIRIITVGGEQLTGDFRVNDSGDIAVPLLGAVHASGLTTSQLEQRIEQELKNRNLFKGPSVSIEVLAYRPIFILGEVSKPGQYPFQPGMTLLTAVAVGGGFTYRAVTDYASVVRSGGDRVVEGRVNRQSFIYPGDVITIYERWF
jgi:polysaccharide export outer membrane protein